jgi:hypothetical protein
MASDKFQDKLEWADVTAADPCPICSKPDWCSVSEDGVWAACRRINNGHGKEKTDRSGNTYWVYRLVPAQGKWDPPCYTLADGKGELADPDTLHNVYTQLLARLPLSPAHEAALKVRGLASRLKESGYRTLGKERARAAYGLVQAGLEHLLPRVPGLFVQQRADGSGYWTVSGGSGILIPVRDSERRIVALLVRSDSTEKGGRYHYLSSKRRRGPRPGSPVHVPPLRRGRLHGARDRGCPQG